MIEMSPADTARKNFEVRELHFRKLELDLAEGDEIPCVVSTDAPVEVGGVIEILEHTPHAVDLSRAPLPLIDAHHTGTTPIGIVDQLRVIGGKLRGVVKFGNTQRAKELLADVKAGVLRSLSIGYQIVKSHLDGRGRRIVTQFVPYEVSCVACPADIGAGFFRSAESIMQEHDERDRCAAIVRASRMFGTEDAFDAISSGESASSYRQKVILQSATRPAALGMSRSELRRYSLARALSSLCEHPHARTEGFEWEIHEELAKRHVDQYGGPLTSQPDSGLCILVPPDVAFDIMRRDLTVASAAQGGDLVDTQNAPTWVELARPRSVALSLGVQSLDGLRSNLTIARETTGPTVTWQATEGSTATESTPGTGQIALIPKTASAYTEFSRPLLLQSSPAVDRFLTRILLDATGVAVDVGVLNGSGAAGEPLGLINTAGIGSVSGTSLALTGVHEFQADIGDALSPFCGYATTRAVAKLLAERERITGSGLSLWTGSLYEGTLGGYRAMSSGNIPAAHLLFGDWPMILLASWGTLAVEINPFANFAGAIIGARVMHSLDVGVLRPSAFSVATATT